MELTKKEPLSNPENGRARSIMRELSDLIRKGKVEVTKLQWHRDTFGAMNLVVNTRIPPGLHARRRRK